MTRWFMNETVTKVKHKTFTQFHWETSQKIEWKTPKRQNITFFAAQPHSPVFDEVQFLKGQRFAHGQCCQTTQSLKHNFIEWMRDLYNLTTSFSMPFLFSVIFPEVVDIFQFMKHFSGNCPDVAVIFGKVSCFSPTELHNIV